MSGRAIAAAALATCMAAGACRQADAAKAAARADSTTLTHREARLERALSGANAAAADSTVERKAVARWVLPRDLDEISGIALTPDGRLLAESDERGQVSEIDYRRGVIVKQFVVGHPTIKADLEAIAVANEEVFMLASNGTLYQFHEGENGERVDYTTHDTRLGKECEFEGLAYDSTLKSLLLACKSVNIDHPRHSLVIFRWRLHGGPDRLSVLTVPVSDFFKPLGIEHIHPSDIAVDPTTGNYVIVASIEQVILVVTPDGRVLSARKLPGDHDQPESVAITRDSILIIGDEAKRRPAVLTLYRWP